VTVPSKATLPVVIVGGGPAGASVALLLARRGVPLVLIEASRDPARRFRGEALMPHGLAALGAMGLLPLPAWVPQRPLRGWRFVFDGQELFRLAEPLEDEGGEGCRLVSQPALLTHLLDQLGNLPNATVLQGERVRGLAWQGERVVGVRLADGSNLAARLVVGADGRSSRLRQQAQLALIPRGDPFDLLWFALPQAGPSPLQGLFTTVVGEAGLFSLFDAAEGAVQLGWLRRAGDPSDTSEDWIARLASQSPADLAAWWPHQAPALSRPTPLRVQVGQAERWWQPGLLLLGDAAHPLSPVRAQGINLALRDAWVAAQALLPLLQSPSDSAGSLELALARIEALRRPEVSRLQQLQAQETARGQLLLERPWLRRLLVASAPLLGSAIAGRWRHDQRQLRQGVIPLPPGTDGPGNDG
jgi:2-polyprenyl-6-methoxyphenol hydroxylase-like FAD-dependent oxidoreductase